MFENSRELLEKYFYKTQASCSLNGTHVLQELRGRLRQLQYSYETVTTLSKKLLPTPSDYGPDGKTNYVLIFLENAPAEENPSRLASLPIGDQDLLIIHLEQFYSSSHRIMDLVNDSLGELPGLTKIKAKGVTIARNHLIEHTRKKGGQPVYTYSLSISGPRLRPVSWSKNNPASKDEGLWANADEFQTNLNASLISGLTRHAD